MKQIRRKLGFAAACVLMLAVSGCKSYWIDADIENRSGETVRELEVDYPTASFGINALAPGAHLHYRFQTRGSGPVRVEYIQENEKTARAQGPTLEERQQGELTILLEANGKVGFLPKLEPAS